MPQNPYCPYCNKRLSWLEKYYFDCESCDEYFAFTDKHELRRITNEKIQETFKNPFEKVTEAILKDRQAKPS